jgi:hypothetical protein
MLPPGLICAIPQLGIFAPVFLCSSMRYVEPRSLNSLMVSQSPHDLFGDMSDLFKMLRLLSFLMLKSTISAKHQQMLTRGLYLTEYKILTVFDQYDDVCTARRSHIYGSARLAGYIYLYLALREVPRTAEIIGKLGKRLRSILEKYKADLLVIWKEDLHLLLWVIFIGGATTSCHNDKVYFSNILKRLTKHMNLETEEDLRKSLKEVVWFEDFCERQCNLAWQGIQTIGAGQIEEV